MTESDIAESILSFIRGEIANPGAEVTAETELFESGLLDSFQLLRLVMHVEAAHGISFKPEELTPDNFGQVSSLSALVAGRIGAGRIGSGA